jgi:hypothetical protein
LTPPTRLNLLTVLLAVAAICAPSAPAEPVVGVNAVNPLRASIADQNSLLAQLHAAGVHVIRCGITADAKGIDFAKRASAQSIRIELLVSPSYPPSAPSRAYQPAAFPSMWGGHPLSSADPSLSKAAFQKLFDLLDENNIPVAAFELGNEINWAAFNPEFPLPGEGKVFSVAELSTDPEAKQIAKGYIQYLKILAVLKEVRDYSRINHSAPILLAGLVSAPDGDKPWNTKKEDKVGLPATIKFMQAHGLDQLVDGYGIHSYPSNDHPGDPAAAARLAARLNTVDLAECRAPGASSGKPCWITEWGFPNSSRACPLNDTARTHLVRETRDDFAAAAKQGRVAGIFYFSWDSDPWSKTADADSVYRCGSLTAAGKLAVAPLDPEAKSETPKPEPTAKAAPESKPVPEPVPGEPNPTLKVRVGVPLVTRGPSGEIADAAFSAFKLPNGKFRGFTAAGVTWAIDGKTPYDMGGAGTQVFKRGPAGSPSACGNWLNHIEVDGKNLIGWVHQETACNYAKDQTHMSMSLATSSDDGMTWKFVGPIISGTDPPTPNKETGDSCGNIVRANDGYFYAYCVHDGGHAWEGGYNFAARAPESNPKPGNWKKYFNGGWTEPGIGGKSSKIDGGGVGWWLTKNETIGLSWIKGGMGLTVSTDHLHFAPLLSAPLMLTEFGDWSRKNGLELYSYQELIDAKTGIKQLGDQWLLSYMYLNPGEDFSKRYLVFQPVDISWSRKPGEPQTGVMLTHWYNAAAHDHRATVSPVSGNYASYKLVAQLGYLMTAPDPAAPTVELEECVSQWPGHPDHILLATGTCESQHYTRLRNAGYVYKAAQPTAQPLYRCYSEADKSHFAANTEACNNQGKSEALLGYDLKD